MSLENQLAEYGRVQEELFGPISIEEITSLRAVQRETVIRRPNGRKHPAALILAAMAAVLLSVGGVSLLIGGPSDPVVADLPTSLSITWSDVPADQIGNLPGKSNGFPPSSLVTNGEVYLAGEDQVFEVRMTWVSPDGITWEQAETGLTPVSGLSGGFLAYRGHFDSPPIQFWRSEDGENWTEASPSTDPTRLASFTWSGLSVDEVLGLRLPELPSSHVHEAGTVLKVGGRFVTYYWSSDGTVEAAVSSDGETWESVDTPDFLAEWFNFSSPRAMSDRDFSKRLWSGTFAAGHGKALALTSDAAGHHLWESIDGVIWDEISSTLPAALMSHSSSSMATRTDPSIYGSHHPTAMETGWALVPWHYPFAPEGSVTYHSIDGMTWNTLSPEPASGVPWFVHAAGNKVFFFTGDSDPGYGGSYQGLHIATMNPEP